MIEISALFDAYINANILLIIGLALWMGTRAVLTRIGFKSAYLTQLGLLNGTFLAILACPFAVAFYMLVQSSGVLGQNLTLNFSDMIVAQYLSGNVAMAPSTFEYTLSLRDLISAEILAYEQPWVQAAGALLGLMAVVIVLRAAQSVLRLRRILKSGYVWKRSGSVEIRLSDRVTVPFSTRGLTKRYIVIPSDMLGRSDDLSMALAHEFHHLRHGDIEWEILLEAIKPLFFWNPAFHIWKRNVEHLRELACDQSIMLRKGLDPRAYGICLLRVAHNAVRRDWSQTVLMPQVAMVQIEAPVLRRDGGTFLRRRVTALLEATDQHVATPGRRAVWIMAPLALMVVLAGISLQKPADWSHDRLMLSTIVNLERMETINGLGVRP